jgi:Na+/H+ antiporter NhaD/arsenite permease-like protein
MYSEPVVTISPVQTCLKIGLMAGITALLGWFANRVGIAPGPLPVVAVCTFVGVICTTLFFWTHRVAVAFLGVAVLIGSRAMTLHGMLRATELDIILFLVGMMIIVGALKDLGFLTWVIQSILNKKRMTGPTFALILCGLSALLSSVVDEVSSIVVVLALVFQVCDTLKIRSTPFVLMAVLCTNIGSAATMLGNPVGIYIGNKAGFTFSQFLAGATPVACVALIATTAIVTLWYRKDIHAMTVAINEHREQHQGLGPLIRIPYRRGLFVLLATVLIIAFHHQIENILGLSGVENKNAFLIITPLIIAGLLMIYRPHRARHYVEHDVEWWTLLFFMLLFAIAGGLEEQGITRHLADKLRVLSKDGPHAMLPFVITLTSLGSAFIDNIVFVAAFTPVIQNLVERAAEYSLLWWAMLFGACFGGNITAVGSTANIVALGMLERRGHAHIGFFEWLKIGSVVGLIAGLIAWGMLSLMPMPAPAVRHRSASGIQGPLHEPHLSPANAAP